jgi:DNA modification methylase
VTNVVELEHGVVIHGSFPQPEVLDCIEAYANAGVKAQANLPLVVADPPYGKIVKCDWDKRHELAADMAQEMIDWTHKLVRLCAKGAALYVWGGYGKPGYRPFYRYLVGAEECTPWRLSMHITWKKKRAYGVQHNYLCTREECAYFVLGDIKKPRLFNVPLLTEKRGYKGYNFRYPAKSEYYRRTCVWTDVTEILRNKIHECQKPEKLYDIQIETHTEPGEIVLDPFAGSGTCGASAMRLGRHYILVERSRVEFDKCVKRLKCLEKSGGGC